MYLPLVLDLDAPTGTTPRTKTAVTANLLTTGTGNSTASSYNTASISPTANTLVLLIVSHVGGSAADPNSVSGAGLTFTKLVSASMEATWSQASIWYACSASPSSGAVTIGFAASHDGARWAIAEFACDCVPADNGKSAILQMGVEAFGGVTTPLTTHIANKSAALDNENAMVLFNCRNQAAAATQTPGTGLTELSDTNASLTADGRFFHLAINWSNVALDDCRFTNNNSGTYGGSIFLELKAKSAGATNYVLTAATGTYTVSGQTANLKYGRKLAAASATYAVAGSAAALRKAHKLGSGVGTYTLAGFAAALRANRRVQAALGTYLVAGTAAGLFKGRTMIAASGAYTVTGFTTNLRRTAKMAAALGTYAVSGQTAGLKAARKMAAGIGAYTVTGFAAGLKRNGKIVAALGTYSWVGFAATLLATGKKITADPGAYVVSGQAAGLKRNRKMTAAVGAYSVVGQTAALRKAVVISAGTGAYTFSYQPAGLKYAVRLSAQIGSYSVQGFDAALSKTERNHTPSMLAETGVYTVDDPYTTELLSTTPVYDTRRIKYNRTRRLGTG